MRFSESFIPTLKETPKGAENVSTALLLRGGFIRKLSSGIINFLPLGLGVIQKIEGIIREELGKIGAEELLLATLQPRWLWEKTGRWQEMGKEMYRLKDRQGKEFTLGMTHEEVITQLIAKEKIPQKLPLALYQIQTKFRDEPRPKGGLLRTKEFLMKDMYSFHFSKDDFKNFYQKTISTYQKIFSRCGLETKLVQASGGAFTREITHEFHTKSNVGEDKIFYCSKCDWAQNEEIAKKKRGKCPDCQKGEILMAKTIELGHIFSLGRKYSSTFDLSLLMGCYGIGIGRLIAAIVEKWNDKKGIIWPDSVSPYQIYLIDLTLSQKGENLYSDLIKKGYQVLYDDRRVPAGVKFVDADLLGMPTRIVLSQKTLFKKGLEVKERKGLRGKVISVTALDRYLISKYN